MRKQFAFVMILVLVLGLLAGCSANNSSDGATTDTQSTFSTLADLENTTIGIVTGTTWDLFVQRDYPNAERKYFTADADVLLALSQGKVDAFFADRTIYTAISWETDAYTYIDEPIGDISNALIFAKEGYDENLLAQVNTFIAKCKEEGTLDQLSNKWFSSKEPEEHPDYSKLTGENGTIRIAVGNAMKPVAYQKGTMYTGYEIDFLTLFAEEYGYKLDLQGMSFDALIPSVASGKCDIGACGITITPERTENVTFSEPHFETHGVAVIRNESAATESNEPTLADFAHAKIGIMTGSSHDGTVKNAFPEAERSYFSTVTDMVIAVEQGKIDAYIEDEPFMTAIRWEGAGVKRLDEPVKQVNNGFAFPQSEESRQLREQINAFIAESKADGTMDALFEKWFAETEPTEHPDYLSLTGENGTIRLAIVVENMPAVYLQDGRYTGYEIELLTRFAEEYGYKFEIDELPFSSVIAGIATGKYDMASASLNITPEREESVDFSDPYASFDVVLVVKDDGTQKPSKTLADFENATIGVMTGAVYDAYAKDRFPNATCSYYSMFSDMILAVEQDKIDGYLTESTYVTAAIWEGAKIQSIGEAIDHTQAGFIFQKSEASAQLREKMNSFIRESKENGTLDALAEKWFGNTEPTEKLDYDSLTGENGTLKVAVAPDLKPISYLKDGELAGYEMEIMLLFAKEYGYKLDMSYMTFDAILPGVTTGKYDIGTGAVTITEERAQSVDFSDSHLTVDVVMVVKAEDEATAVQASFWDDVKEDFEKTFIREDRWKLIAQGIGVTMLISICAGIGGTLLGFGLYLLSRSDRKLLQATVKKVAKVYSRIIAGTPIVVILMILFYVVFGKIKDMSGVIVAIIGFTLTFGAFVYDHMTVSVGSVDLGQTEAAYALGYPKNKTFFRIIFPQAMNIFLPSYCNQAVELIKATAVVGYVAVNDLTKMGDIIRSNTYEAFFPLIATAVIYFLLTWILSLLLGLVKMHFEPKRRSKKDILKGVKTV